MTTCAELIVRPEPVKGPLFIVPPAVLHGGEGQGFDTLSPNGKGVSDVR
jgi:hypothetical protein